VGAFLYEKGKAMVRPDSQFLIINGVQTPCPAVGMEIIESVTVDSGRNSNGGVVGQVIGRPLWKINNLHWVGLTPEQWTSIKNALAPFFVPVTFTDDTNQRRTVYMYPSDKTGQPLFTKGMSYTQFRDCKFNLIDCGW